MKWATNKILIANSVFEHGEPLSISSPSTNPFHHLETPEEKSLGKSKSLQVRSHDVPTSSSPYFHDFADGTQGVVKHNRKDALHESLAYQIGKMYGRRKDGTNLVPKTVTRNLKHPNQDNAKPSSVQQMVPGFQPDFKTPINEPTWHAHEDAPAVGLLDFLLANHDRSRANIGKGRDGRIYAIDNGWSLNPHTDLGYSNDYEGTVSGNSMNLKTHNDIPKNMYYMGDQVIPQHVRDAYLKNSPRKAMKLFNDATNHPLYEQGIENPFGTPGTSFNPQTSTPEEIANYKRQMEDYRKTPEFKRHVDTQRIIAQDEFKKRLMTLMKHLSNPQVRTMDDLNERLHPGIIKHMMDKNK